MLFFLMEKGEIFCTHDSCCAQAAESLLKWASLDQIICFLVEFYSSAVHPESMDHMGGVR